MPISPKHIQPVGDAVAVDASSRYALLAVQGPKALEILQPLTGVDLASIKYYWFAHGEVASVRATISRTGYTGEDGFEMLIPPQSADRVWQAVLEAGKSADLVPCGLGARDTLRLEAGMRLHGNDIDDATTVLEADLGWIVGWNKPDFIGAAVLRKQKAEGVTRKLVGFRDARSRHRAPRLRRLCWGDESRPCDQRHPDALLEESHWHGVPAC